MIKPIAILADPGIDGAFAIALAMQDPRLDLVGLAATAGNVSAEQATKNVQIIVEQIDPTRWPRLGASPHIEYESDRTRVHGREGLGGVTFPSALLHRTPPSDKLLVDLAKQYAKELTLLTLGPLTVLARAIDKDPELPKMLQRIICMGGTWKEAGNASAVADFHFYCDPAAARKVLHCGTPITLIPLDVLRASLFGATALLELPKPESRTCRFLRRIVPFAINATSNLFGIEGFHLNDVLAVVAAAHPHVFDTRPLAVDVETRGELTRGMSVVDVRPDCPNPANVDLVVEVDARVVHGYFNDIFSSCV